MKPKEIGLRHRLRRAVRQIGAQHEHLRAAHRAVAESAAAGDVAEVTARLDQLSGAVDAHFSLEESVFFPAIHGLHSESESSLEQLVCEHEELQEDLGKLRRALATESLHDFVERYRAFATSTAEHEAREERLLGSLAHLFEGDG